MKALVTGVHGQLGHDIIKELKKRNISYIGTDLNESDEKHYIAIDLCDHIKVKATLNQLKPDIVFHCAAWTAVDLAEDEVEKCMAVNYEATRSLCEACRDINATILYISTDYVFNGQGDTPWDEDCELFEPLNVYGKSKLLGENAVKQFVDHYFIVRTAWVFGNNGHNFIKTILSLGHKKTSIQVVNDQIGTPTYTYDLARLLVDMSQTNRYGVYHATNEGGYISWYDFACEIYKQAGLTTIVNPVTTDAYGKSKAKRPFNSRLSKKKLQTQGFTPLPDWKDALSRYLAQLGYNKK